MENETLIAENVEIDMETLTSAEYGWTRLAKTQARIRVTEAVIKALSPESRNKLEEYREQ